jgi:hypothetical protein
MRNRVLCVRFDTPIRLCGKLTNEVILLNVNCSESEAEQLTRNVLNGVDTGVGEYSVAVSDESGNPLNPQNVKINLQNIVEIERR